MSCWRKPGGWTTGRLSQAADLLRFLHHFWWRGYRTPGWFCRVSGVFAAQAKSFAPEMVLPGCNGRGAWPQASASSPASFVALVGSRLSGEQLAGEPYGLRARPSSAPSNHCGCAGIDLRSRSSRKPTDVRTFGKGSVVQGRPARTVAIRLCAMVEQPADRFDVPSPGAAVAGPVRRSGWLGWWTPR